MHACTHTHAHTYTHTHTHPPLICPYLILHGQPVCLTVVTSHIFQKKVSARGTNFLFSLFLKKWMGLGQGDYLAGQEYQIKGELKISPVYHICGALSHCSPSCWGRPNSTNRKTKLFPYWQAGSLNQAEQDWSQCGLLGFRDLGWVSYLQFALL